MLQLPANMAEMDSEDRAAALAEALGLTLKLSTMARVPQWQLDGFGAGSRHYWATLRLEDEDGQRSLRVSFHTGSAIEREDITAVDVFYSVLSDVADLYCYGDIAEWAESLGMNDNIRRAVTIWRAVHKERLALREFLGWDYHRVLCEFLGWEELGAVASESVEFVPDMY